MIILSQVTIASNSCTQCAVLIKVRRALRPAATVLADKYDQLRHSVRSTRKSELYKTKSNGNRDEGPQSVE